jgi:hypothetical protein
MRPDAFFAFQQALNRGPGYCPPDLFEGGVPSIVRGLKVHANNISHARHVALEETYPRLLKLIGLESFHEVAGRFLDQAEVLGRSLDLLGEGLDQCLDDPSHRNLARAEWAWLEAFHAADAHALTLAELAALDPETLTRAHFTLHPATRWFALEEPYELAWDHPVADPGNALLLTRPESEVQLRGIDGRATAVLSLLSVPRTPADLLGTEALALIALIEAGAVVLEQRP